jgi:signal transduction histidine kinase
LADAFQRQLIGIAGHDLRNPLTTIAMSASLLRGGPYDNERCAKLVTRIITGAKRMERIIGDLADYSRARVGSPLPLEIRVTDFNRICETVIDGVLTEYPQRIIHYEPGTEPLGMWDAERLEQVVQNLVTNALKYGAPDRPVRICWWRTEDGQLFLEVSNHGSPIPAPSIPYIFEPFRMGERRTSGSTRSLGLGLFIVREIIRAHGGTVSVRSDSENGTRFTVALPASCAHRAYIEDDGTSDFRAHAPTGP